MKRSFCYFFLATITIHTVLAHVFYHDIMSEDDVTYGLPNVRVRRDSWGSKGRIGPLYTHVKTDFAGTFKWGTKHMVGKMFGGRQNSEEEDFDN